MHHYPAGPRPSVVEFPNAHTVELELLARGREAEDLSAMGASAMPPAYDPVVVGANWSSRTTLNPSNPAKTCRLATKASRLPAGSAPA